MSVNTVSLEPHTCPLCGLRGEPDDRGSVEIAGLVFESVACDRTGELPGSGGEQGNTMPGHVFPERWLEGQAEDGDELMDFTKAFAYVRPPFEPGSAIEAAFGDRDARLAWLQHTEPDATGRVRVLIRL